MTTRGQGHNLQLFPVCSQHAQTHAQPKIITVEDLKLRTAASAKMTQLNVLTENAQNHHYSVDL